VKWTKNLRSRLGWDSLPQTLRRIIVGIMGGTILLVGIALIVLPGPAFIVIPLGLVILGSEFAWARWLVRRAKGMLAKVSGKRAENLTPEQKR
jgi:uncharacterized membrane protein YbaN (DUF454 family)